MEKQMSQSPFPANLSHNPSPPLYTFSCRITPNQFEDRLNPQVLSLFDDPKIFPVCLIFREFATGVKLHYHSFFKTILKKSSIRKRIKKIYSGNRQYQLHPIAIGDQIVCTNPKHDKKHCMLSAQTYTAKEGDIIYRHGFTAPQVEQLIQKGKEILSFVKQKIHKKIIQKYKINVNSSSKMIISSYLNYRQSQGHAGFPANKFVVQSVLNDILQDIDPKYVTYLSSEYAEYLNVQRGRGDPYAHYEEDPFLDEDTPRKKQYVTDYISL